MGLAIGGAVFPVAFSITWKKQSNVAAISGALSGLAAGLIAWLVTAKAYYGRLDLETTNSEYSTLAGNLAAISIGGIVSTVVTLIKPDDFDWEITRAINAENANLDGVEATATPSAPAQSTGGDLAAKDEKEISSDAPTPSDQSDKNATDVEQAPVALTQTISRDQLLEESPQRLRSALKVAIIASITIPFIMDFLVPMPMFFSQYIFSKGFFTGWVVISFIWVFTSTAITCILPIWETRQFLGDVVGRMVRGEKH